MFRLKTKVIIKSRYAWSICWLNVFVVSLSILEQASYTYVKVVNFMSLTFLFEIENRLGSFLSWRNKINISLVGIVARVALTGTFELNLGDPLALEGTKLFPK